MNYVALNVANWPALATVLPRSHITGCATEDLLCGRTNNRSTYEQLPPWDHLEYVENPAVPFTHHVERMRLNKDKTTLKINNALTLANIPPEVFEYRLGNRSALEWIIDQYRITEDPRAGIRSDPNRPDDPEYILHLVGQVIRVSLETVKIIRALPENYTAA